MTEILRNKTLLSFLYDGESFEKAVVGKKTEENGNVITTTYELKGGLRVTNTLRLIPEFDAFEVVNRFENDGSEASGIVSELWDCEVTLPMEHEENYRYSAYIPDAKTATKIYAPMGSTWDVYEFSSNPDEYRENRYVNFLYPGNSRRFASFGGRSCDGNAPFFNIHKNGHGYIYAVGWTGQWNFETKRGNDEITLRSKIEDTNFRVLPGESFRTSSAVVMAYDGDFLDSQNKWRRLVKKRFSLIGTEGRDKYGPVCASIWGGMDTDEAIRRINVIRDNKIPFTYVWMDAGWYGADTKPTPDEFEGDWGNHTGDWVVSPLVHPDGLKDFSKAVHDAGMKLILWFEPERVVSGTPTIKAHPEYFLGNGDPNPYNNLLDLGNDDAWNYIYETLSGLIESIGIDCYRQDFNFAPLSYWRHNDAEDRRGIHEIKHIGGLYRLWDALLERFPHLIIDNCASGGRRIDIEMLRRSIPLWRSDYECPANFGLPGVQAHHISFNLWMPYSGSGSGRLYDTYRMRSSYDSSLTTNYCYSQRNDFGGDPEKLAWLRRCVEEARKVQPYFSEDIYPLTEVSDKEDVWSAAQFNRPDESDGIVQVFRRDEAPYTECEFTLRGLDKDKTYVFTDADTNETTEQKGGEIFRVRMQEKHSAKIFFYKIK